MKLNSKLFSILLALFSGSLILSFTHAAESVDADAALAELRAALEAEASEFEVLYEAAREAGAPESELAEMRLLKVLGEGDLLGLMKMVPELEALANEWNFGPNRVFSYEAQLMGLVHALKAIDANHRDDIEAFELHAKEAFWLAPQLTEAFGLSRLIQHHQESLYQEALMSNLIIPMDTALMNTDETTHTLAEMVEGNKALLLDFWASWCGPCIRLMPDLKAKAHELKPQGIRVIGVNTDQDQPIQKALEIREQFEMDFDWMVEQPETPLSLMLMVDSIPRMVLIAPNGKVLFNGHPLDPKLTLAIESLREEA